MSSPLPRLDRPSLEGFLNGPTDTTTALTHLGAREYDPTLARFLSVDPLLDPYDPLHLNAYGYGKNNPLKYADPDGREPRMIGGEWHDHGINFTELATEKRRLQSGAANWAQTPEARDWASNRAEGRRLAQQVQQGAQERADYQDRQDFRWWNPTTWHVQDGDLLRHQVLHRVSWVTNGVATVADGIAVGCARLVPPGYVS